MWLRSQRLRCGPDALLEALATVRAVVTPTSIFAEKIYRQQLWSHCFLELFCSWRASALCREVFGLPCQYCMHLLCCACAHTAICHEFFLVFWCGFSRVPLTARPSLCSPTSYCSGASLLERVSLPINNRTHYILLLRLLCCVYSRSPPACAGFTGKNGCSCISTSRRACNFLQLPTQANSLYQCPPTRYL